jgi:hypothetical protein
MREELKQRIFHGSPSWETSVAGQNIIQDFIHPNGGIKEAYKLEFYTKGQMTVSINGSDPIFLDNGEEMELVDIWSFKLLTGDVVFRYIAYL